MHSGDVPSLEYRHRLTRATGEGDTCGMSHIDGGKHNYGRECRPCNVCSTCGAGYNSSRNNDDGWCMNDEEEERGRRRQETRNEIEEGNRTEEEEDGGRGRN